VITTTIMKRRRMMKFMALAIAISDGRFFVV